MRVGSKSISDLRVVVNRYTSMTTNSAVSVPWLTPQDREAGLSLSVIDRLITNSARKLCRELARNLSLAYSGLSTADDHRLQPAASKRSRPSICSVSGPSIAMCALTPLNRRRAWPGPHMQGPGEEFARRRAPQQPPVPVRVPACVVEA